MVVISQPSRLKAFNLDTCKLPVIPQSGKPVNFFFTLLIDTGTVQNIPSVLCFSSNIPVFSIKGSYYDCKRTARGTEYDGTAAKTVSGKTCQRWDSQSPHAHTRNNVTKFPEDSLDAASNYCRNPDNEPKGPWCYTTDPAKRWEYCAVPACE